MRTPPQRGRRHDRHRTIRTTAPDQTAGLRVVPPAAGAPARFVFLHGLGATSRYWTCTRARRPDAAYVDLFGFGGSPRPLVRYTVERHLAMLHGALSGQRGYVLVGHSLGAALALAYAARHPDDIDGLVLLGLPHYGSRRAAARWLRQHPSGWITTNLAATAVACVLTRRVLGPLLPRLLPDYPREVAEDLVEHNVLSSTTSLWEVLYGHDLAADAGALPDHIVVQAVHGTRDTTAPITTVRTLAATRGWRLAELDGIDHHPWLRAPAACDRALADVGGAVAQRHTSARTGASGTQVDGSLLTCIGTKAETLRTSTDADLRRLEPIAGEVETVSDDLAERDAIGRMWRRDHTLWQDDPTEVADRLGWLSVAEDMQGEVGRLRDFAEEAHADGLTHALVLGMGGSSLFPLVVGRTFSTTEGALELHVLDSDDHGAIARVEADLPLDRTLVIASSKSGTTAETRSLLEYFWEAGDRDPDRFVVITDPDTPLAELGTERGFRAVFAARPDLGGRYSALSHFGLVPAALAGVDVAELLHRAGRMAAASADCVPRDDNAGLQLAAVLAGAARAGRDKLTLHIDDRFAAFGAWIEQLIAESTGKHDQGIVPVVGEPLGDPEVYGEDRLFVGIGVDPADLEPLADAGHPVIAFPLDDPVDLGAEVLRWEIATALAGASMGINPFDQPDVEAAKGAARDSLDGGERPVETRPVGELLETLEAGDYLAIQVYVDPEDAIVGELEQIRRTLRDRHRVATTLGVGPRYLHSTGQLHKGGPNSGVFLQVLGNGDGDLPIPGEDFGFADLERAQAHGDLHALNERGRRAGRIDIDDLRKVTA